jgi:hypothetical protein
VLGRKDCTREELGHAKAADRQQVAAYKKMALATSTDKKVGAALEDFETG